MNAATRKRIAELQTRLGGLHSELEQEQCIEQDKFDSMPEHLQGNANGQRIQAAATALQEAMDSLQECIDSLDTAME